MDPECGLFRLGFRLSREDKKESTTLVSSVGGHSKLTATHKPGHDVQQTLYFFVAYKTSSLCFL